ncbi:EamA family transporter RarD [Vibrio salinus]|uniref:EamA family transporter RarD n=1 Tax=Vibrio salinus TaxID=2899784 RepID=UPI001E4ED77B|nr:EamA family transporter RarD [Vibrio salinus]MCE0494789.1 EamA family transporter RarD [Vibrio salinus]
MRLSNVMAAFAFACWGFSPLYYQFISHPAMDELLALRIIASVPLCGLIAYAVNRSWPQISAILADHRSLFFCILGALLISTSSYIFIWAVVNNRTTDASLGFFISPLILATLGIVFSREKLSHGMVLSLILGLSGVVFLSLQYGHVPYIAFMLALLFTLYSWCKRYVRYNWATSLYVEAIAMLPVATIYLLYKEQTVGCVSFTLPLQDFLLYIGAAPITILPLLLYSLALRNAKMSTIGIMQYIEPSLQFLIATFAFHEACSEVKLISFSLIWLGLVFVIIEQLVSRYSVLQSINMFTYPTMKQTSDYPTVEMMRKTHIDNHSALEPPVQN